MAERDINFQIGDLVEYDVEYCMIHQLGPGYTGAGSEFYTAVNRNDGPFLVVETEAGHGQIKFWEQKGQIYSYDYAEMFRLLARCPHAKSNDIDE